MASPSASRGSVDVLLVAGGVIVILLAALAWATSSRSDWKAKAEKLEQTVKTQADEINALTKDLNLCRVERNALEKGLAEIKQAQLRAEEAAAMARAQAEADKAKSASLVAGLKNQVEALKAKPPAEDQQCAVVRKLIRDYVEGHNARLN